MKYWFIGGPKGSCGFVTEDPPRIEGLISAFIHLSNGFLENKDFTVTEMLESDVSQSDKTRAVAHNKLADLFAVHEIEGD